jgi:hydrogenase assembly chaperone HypC/HupF
MTECVADHGCITCGDAAIPMRIVDIDSKLGLALCATPGGERESVEIALVEPVCVGDWLLVHAGTALSEAVDPYIPAVEPRTLTVESHIPAVEPRIPAVEPRIPAVEREVLR